MAEITISNNKWADLVRNWSRGSPGLFLKQCQGAAGLEGYRQAYLALLRWKRFATAAEEGKLTYENYGRQCTSCPRVQRGSTIKLYPH